MKKPLFALFALLLSVTAFSRTAKTDTSKAPEISFEKLKWTYPEIPYQSGFTKEFVFKNTGKSPLIISSAQTSCGCDVVSFPREPILPGKTGVIKYSYDTNRIGPFTKGFTLSSNAKTATVCISISGKVAPPKEKEPVEAPAAK